MKILGIDTSSKVASVALCDDDKLICEVVVNNKLTHSETLMPIVSDVFKRSELSPSDVDLFAVSNGPGSFTGLRIGVTALKGLAHAVDKDVVGVNTLEALAYNLSFCNKLIVPIMDARRGEVYNAIYRFEKGNLMEICPPRALPLKDVIAELQEKNEGVVFLGDGVPVFKEEIIQKLGNLAEFAPQNLNMQRASSVCEAAKNQQTQKYFELTPNYFRKSQAERELEERGNK